MERWSDRVIEKQRNGVMERRNEVVPERWRDEETCAEERNAEDRREELASRFLASLGESHVTYETI